MVQQDRIFTARVFIRSKIKFSDEPLRLLLKTRPSCCKQWGRGRGQRGWFSSRTENSTVPWTAQSWGNQMEEMQSQAYVREIARWHNVHFRV